MKNNSNDITKCSGEKYKKECPFKNKCRRYLVKDSTQQIYFLHAPYDSINKECQYYLPDHSEN